MTSNQAKKVRAGLIERHTFHINGPTFNINRHSYIPMYAYVYSAYIYEYMHDRFMTANQAKKVRAGPIDKQTFNIDRYRYTTYACEWRSESRSVDSPHKHLAIFKGAPLRLPNPLSDQFPVRVCSCPLCI